MSYVDGFVIPVPTKRLSDYKKLARKASKIWLEYGALSYAECLGDDVRKGKVTDFQRSVKLKKGETAGFRLDHLQVPQTAGRYFKENHERQAHEKRDAGKRPSV